MFEGYNGSWCGMDINLPSFLSTKGIMGVEKSEPVLVQVSESCILTHTVELVISKARHYNFTSMSKG